MQQAIDKIFRVFFWTALLITAAGVCGIAGRTIARKMIADVRGKIQEIQSADYGF